MLSDALMTSKNRSNLKEKRFSKDIPEIVGYDGQQNAMDLIDEIHDESNEKIDKGIPLLKDNLKRWVDRNEQPCNMDKVLRVSLIDARRREEHKEK